MFRVAALEPLPSTIRHVPNPSPPLGRADGGTHARVWPSRIVLVETGRGDLSGNRAATGRLPTTCRLTSAYVLHLLVPLVATPLCSPRRTLLQASRLLADPSLRRSPALCFRVGPEIAGGRGLTGFRFVRIAVVWKDDSTARAFVYKNRQRLEHAHNSCCTGKADIAAAPYMPLGASDRCNVHDVHNTVLGTSKASPRHGISS